MTEAEKEIKDITSHIPLHIRITLQEIYDLVHGADDQLCSAQENFGVGVTRQITCARALTKSALGELFILACDLESHCQAMFNGSTPDPDANPA